MNFKSLNIKNYRGIGENCLKVDNFGDINIFTGKNNSGKSTLLEAIFQVANVVNANGTISELYQARQSLIVQNSDLLPMFYMLNTNNSPFFEVQIKNTKTIRIRKVKIEANRDNVIEMNQLNSIATPNKLKGINFKLEINNNLEFESTVNIIP